MARRASAAIKEFNEKIEKQIADLDRDLDTNRRQRDVLQAKREALVGLLNDVINEKKPHA